MLGGGGCGGVVVVVVAVVVCWLLVLGQTFVRLHDFRDREGQVLARCR